jgi:hypothetical protein
MMASYYTTRTAITLQRVGSIIQVEEATRIT